MGKRLTPDHPGLKRIRDLVDEGKFFDLPSSNPPITQQEIDRAKREDGRCNRKFIEAATRRVDREQDLARKRRESRDKALDEAKEMKY